MTISGITGATNPFSSIDPAETVGSGGGSLAVMVLNQEAGRRQSDREALTAAREDFEVALDDEVESMHEAADLAFWGAVTQGALSVASGALTVHGAFASNARIEAALVTKDEALIAAATAPTTTEALGRSLGQLSEPAGVLASRSNGQHAQADAKQAAGEGEQARWRMDDMKDALERSEQRTERTSEWLESLVDKRAGTMGVVIGNIA
jgi:hypothetical protein